MSVYTDGEHLIADSDEELHIFAQEMGLKREWFQNHRWPHYDLTTTRAMSRAVRGGAKLVTSRQILEVLKRGSNER